MGVFWFTVEVCLQLVIGWVDFDCCVEKIDRGLRDILRVFVSGEFFVCGVLTISSKAEIF